MEVPEVFSDLEMPVEFNQVGSVVDRWSINLVYQTTLDDDDAVGPGIAALSAIGWKAYHPLSRTLALLGSNIEAYLGVCRADKVIWITPYRFDAFRYLILSYSREATVVCA
jgi:hypothetical protein